MATQGNAPRIDPEDSDDEIPPLIPRYARQEPQPQQNRFFHGGYRQPRQDRFFRAHFRGRYRITVNALLGIIDRGGPRQ